MLRALAVVLFTTQVVTVAAQEVRAPAALPTSTTRLLPVSGTLTDAAGTPLTGSVAVTFSLYDSRENGTNLWSETQDVQADARGSFTAYLGTVTPVPQAAVSEERARWLGMEVEGRQLPRVMLVAVPYALRAADAETLGGTPLSSFVTKGGDGRLRTAAGDVSDPLVDGTGVPGQLAKFLAPTTLSSSVISESATNRIGVGLPDPTGGGVVDSVFTIRNLDNNTGFAVLNQTQQRRFALNTLSNGAWTLYDGAGGTWNAGLQQNGGRIGVGIGGSLVHKVEVFYTGNFSAGVFQISNPASGSPALQALTNGPGPALRAASFVGSGGLGILVEAAVLSGNLIVAKSDNVNRFRVNGLGGVFAASYTMGGADFAEEIEPYESRDRYEPGDVLTVATDRNRTVLRATRPYDTTVIGIYSTQPGITASPHAMDDPRREGTLPVAMVGIVPCKVSAENGPIARGDLLVSSSTAGHAMKGTDRSRMTGAIVGKALEPLAAGRGKILVAVTLQ